MPQPATNRRVHWLAYLWPGLPHLWVRGSWAGLVLAFGFGLLLNLTIVGTLIWPEMFPPRVKVLGGAILGVLWVVALLETRAELKRLAAQKEGETSPQELGAAEIKAKVDRQFAAAQLAYLAGDWAETERHLLDALKLDGDDIECDLMLATLWGRTGRKTDAARRLKRIAKLDAALPWMFEISRELTRINSAAHADDPPPTAQAA